jgi:SAM-dependent methyltransferase
MANLSEKLSQDYYERAWENWNERSALGPASRHVRRLVCSMIRELDFDSYLDAGCGGGSLLREIHLQYPKAEVCGVDLSQKGIEIAQRNNPGISIFQLDLTHQTMSKKFDLVTCVDLLEHIEDDEGVLYNIHKMTGKYFLLVTPIGRLMKEENVRLGHVHGYSKDEVRQKLHQAGFQVMREMEWGFPFYTLYRRIMLLLPEESITGHFDWKKRLISAFTYQLLFLDFPFWGDRYHALCHV